MGFIFSKASAPAGLEPLNRWGQDILVSWDSESPATDVYLKAAISLARFLVIQQSRVSEATTVCVAEMNTAVSTLTRDIALLDDISRLAQTVTRNGESIVTKLESLRKKVEKQIDVLREHISAMPNGATALTDNAGSVSVASFVS